MVLPIAYDCSVRLYFGGSIVARIGRVAERRGRFGWESEESLNEAR